MSFLGSLLVLTDNNFWLYIELRIFRVKFHLSVISCYLLFISHYLSLYPYLLNILKSYCFYLEAITNYSYLCNIKMISFFIAL